VTTEAELTGRIKRIKAQLVALGDLRPGALSEQYNTCRSAGCRCKADPPAKHGPYHQLRGLIDEWVDAAIELDRLRRTQPR